MLDWIGRQRHKRRTPNSDPAPESVVEAQSSDHAPVEQPTTRVLVIDDDLFIGRMMIEVLGPYYDVEVACDATEAGLAIERRHPDLIILDIMMPGQDGQEIGYQLQRHAITRQIPFILVSGDRQIAQKAKAVHAAGYLAKPFNIDELAALVARVLAEHK